MTAMMRMGGASTTKHSSCCWCCRCRSCLKISSLQLLLLLILLVLILSLHPSSSRWPPTASAVAFQHHHCGRATKTGMQSRKSCLNERMLIPVDIVGSHEIKFGSYNGDSFVYTSPSSSHRKHQQNHQATRRRRRLGSGHRLRSTSLCLSSQGDDAGTGEYSSNTEEGQDSDAQLSSSSNCSQEKSDNERGDGNNFFSKKNKNRNELDKSSSSKKHQRPEQKPSILQMINPFNAGKSLRSKVESAIDLASAITAISSTSLSSSTSSSLLSPSSRLVPPDRRSIYYNYYVDDQLGLSSSELNDAAISSATISSSSMPSSAFTFSRTKTSSSSLQQQQDKDIINEDYRPEVLIIGATGSLGRIIVKRLILENKVRIRVLVRDLYSHTLNKLGVGVTYCQGDLSNIESLEYAVTDVDKIIFVAGNNMSRSRNSRNRNRNDRERKDDGELDDDDDDDDDNDDWDRLESILNQRRQQAELVDSIGLRNLLHAYLNVRHSDYGPSQAAKRTLFKFRKRPADFGLFGIDDGSSFDHDGDIDDDDDCGEAHETNKAQSEKRKSISSSSSSSFPASSSQCDWTKNKFGHGVFVGKVGRYAEAALSSARLRSRNDPDQGIDLSVGGFAGIVCRLCSDGGVYEAFVRTEAFERLGVEYVCEFKTSSKTPTSGNENRSRDKFSTVRLEFKDFLPRMRPQFQTKEDEEDSREALGKSGNIPKFVGKDIRQLGFRFRGQSNPLSCNAGFCRFYLALDFIKVYRGQPEPEFIYLSDARIPPVVNDGMVKHDIKRLTTNPTESNDFVSILDENKAIKITIDKTDRSSEETYFKYMGEEMIKQSGLSYTIIRVAGYNEKQPGTDSSTVRLQKMNKDIVPVSRADLAQVVASAILEPNACNLVLYMTKSQTRGVKDGYLWEKFARLRKTN